ncbi:hypothetical protein DRO57_07450 [Candidatus Bathyarchaeota archaeon]|nr:MAG: hypothetical protein DRO57_07450 [Candidatus Bathyarchaeota archaeon]
MDMSRDDFEALRRSVAAILTVSLLLIFFRILGFRLLEDAFETLCIHIPALSALILYISIRIGWLKIGGQG